MGKYLYICLWVFSIVVQLCAVTVNSLCPTNKIAPHRRHASWELSRPRTLGLIYELLGPRRPPQNDPINDLQEQPQEDDPDDCGEIDDYDETDLSSVTQGTYNRRTDKKNHIFFGNNHARPPYYPASSGSTSSPQRPQRPVRPSYGSGVYGFQGYRPPSFHPSENIKPVKEDTMDSPQAIYRPNLVGGTQGHIVGFPLIKHTTEMSPNSYSSTSFRFPDRDSHVNRRQKKSQQINKSTSIIGSFADLLFN